MKVSSADRATPEIVSQWLIHGWLSVQCSQCWKFCSCIPESVIMIIRL